MVVVSGVAGFGTRVEVNFWGVNCGAVCCQ